MVEAGTGELKAMGGLQDKLKKLEVDVGGEVLKIVTNASNVKEPRHISVLKLVVLDFAGCCWMKVSLWQAGGNKGTTILILKQLNKLTILTNNCVALSFSHFLIPLLEFFDQGVLCSTALFFLGRGPRTEVAWWLPRWAPSLTASR